MRADAARARALRSSLPVGYDHDGAVANEYAVVVCPTITYVARGGRSPGSTVGPLDEAALEALGAADRVSAEPPIVAGPVDPRSRPSCPGVRLAWCAFAVDGEPAAALARRRCARGCARCRTATAARDAIALSQRARSRTPTGVLFRTLGIEPDAQRIPAEELTARAADPRRVPLARRAARTRC